MMWQVCLARAPSCSTAHMCLARICTWGLRRCRPAHIRLARAIAGPGGCSTRATPTVHQRCTGFIPALHQCHISVTPIQFRGPMSHQRYTSTIVGCCTSTILSTSVTQRYTRVTPALHQRYTSVTPALLQWCASFTPALHQCYASVSSL